MTRYDCARDPERVYGRDLRLAAAAALGLFVAGFLFVRIPEAGPCRLPDKLEPIVISLPTNAFDLPPADPRGLPERPAGAARQPDGRQGGQLTPAPDAPDLPAVPGDLPRPLDPVPYEKVEVPPRILERVVPDYPELCRQAGIKGLVVVEFVIDTAGVVRDAAVLESSGNSLLDAAAVAAVRGFRFTPGYQLDRPVPVRAKLPFNFRLD